MLIETNNGMERVLKVKWNKRCIDRVYKWLKLKGDYSGFVYRNGKKIGYKIEGKWLKHMFFYFPNYEIN